MKKITKISIVIVSIIVVLFLALVIYSSNPYTALEEMDDNITLLDLDNVTRTESRDNISYQVDSPLKNIVFIPGGLVEPDSYEYLAAALAANGYNVTIFKPLLNLAIFTPNYAKKFLDEDLENIVIGHSLGGVVASMLSSDNDLVDKVILLGSYPIKDLTDKSVLLITAEHDDGLDPDKFEESLEYVNEDTMYFHITEGNHAQFGWYGPQKGDGEATITTLEQQTLVINEILFFIE